VICFLVILATPILAFAYGLHRGRWEFARANYWILAILPVLLLGYELLFAQTLYSGPPRPPRPDHTDQFVAALIGLPIYGLLVYRATQFMLVRPTWMCRCGYNLTGNVSGVCPECGGQILVS
jgi:hypothetical protein